MSLSVLETGPARGGSLSLNSRRVKEDKTLARLTQAEQVLLRAVLYLLRDSEQRAQLEIPTADEARTAEITENQRVAEGLLESITELLAK
jgi:hypothetical protein